MHSLRLSVCPMSRYFFPHNKLKTEKDIILKILGKIKRTNPIDFEKYLNKNGLVKGGKNIKKNSYLKNKKSSSIRG